jgi:hypothetical protein
MASERASVLAIAAVAGVALGSCAMTPPTPQAQAAAAIAELRAEERADLPFAAELADAYLD